eukprot:m.480937 g.480937  ORF g.480937 m.480937 type:complete len:123 (+) comp21712_c0_seq6:775-1143(+)
MIREQIEILQAAVEDEQGASTVTIGGQSMTLERLEEAYRMLTMEEWKFVYIESDDRNAFVNSCVPRRVFVPAGLVRLCSEANLDGALALVGISGTVLCFHPSTACSSIRRLFPTGCGCAETY